ncbi:hypothetical protein CHLNCDRAFT_133688 [Chlorella variabilis]|uniref:Expansin-like EG45 domain-containing protein n=1 Tax=Chlorella variabilis TaxID=554065 RepID=E1Z3K7_CHLVA|nr:hypothetical protein CHLNCDRAFT_133688 [Chlorella variabilis]EFN60179.1 hypothetical protein CHLNCDRAFT_133688 [Chlorella variabilis]|eukprot:XP_005852281.1 hypothetical protein CHLNCDRAFT_133688 [Chlorella variabilis]
MDGGGLNACQLQELPRHFERFYAYLPSSLFDIGQHCGRCVRVKGLDVGSSQSSFTLLVVDQCITCDDGSLDVSAEALEALSGSPLGSTEISWQFVSCDEEADLSPVETTQQEKKNKNKKGWRKKVSAADGAGSEEEAAEEEPAVDAAVAAQAETAADEPASRKLLRLRR